MTCLECQDNPHYITQDDELNPCNCRSCGGFKEWHDTKAKNGTRIALFSLEEAWEACSLYHIKKLQEKDAEIERLQKENEELKFFIKDIHQRLRDNESELRILANIEQLLEAKGVK